jgi:hypothetical protein
MRFHINVIITIISTVFYLNACKISNPDKNKIIDSTTVAKNMIIKPEVYLDTLVNKGKLKLIFYGDSLAIELPNYKAGLPIFCDHDNISIFDVIFPDQILHSKFIHIDSLFIIGFVQIPIHRNIQALILKYKNGAVHYLYMKQNSIEESLTPQLFSVPVERILANTYNKKLLLTFTGDTSYFKNNHLVEAKNYTFWQCNFYSGKIKEFTIRGTGKEKYDSIAQFKLFQMATLHP